MLCEAFLAQKHEGCTYWTLFEWREGTVLARKIIFNGWGLNGDELYGIHRNTLELLRELDASAGDLDIEVLVPEGRPLNAAFKNIEVSTEPIFSQGSIGKIFWANLTFSRYVKAQGGFGVDLVLGLPIWGCSIVAVYDCIIELFPQNASTLKKKLGRLLYMFRVKSCMRHSRLIVADSRSAKNDIARIYDINPDKIQIVPCGWQHFARVKSDKSVIERLGLEDTEFFFSLGTRTWHKNYRWIVEAARQNPRYVFVISGSERFGKETLGESAPANVLFAGYLSDGEVKALMESCKAFVHPSLYEGFGIPPMEALSTGAECLVSNAGALPEVYGNSVRYFDPKQYEHIDMDKLLAQPVGERSSVLANYSWEKSAKILRDLLEGLS